MSAQQRRQFDQARRGKPQPECNVERADWPHLPAAPVVAVIDDGQDEDRKTAKGGKRKRDQEGGVQGFGKAGKSRPENEGRESRNKPRTAGPTGCPA